MIDTIETRVSRGADALDANYYEWFKMIDLEEFDMNQCDRCVLGQLYGSYLDRNQIIVGLDLKKEGDFGTYNDLMGYLGFTATDYNLDADYEFDLLRQEWSKQILKRRTA